MDNYEKYVRVFTDVFNVDRVELNDSFTFANTSFWDSLAHMELITKLEDTFDVMFEPDDILHFESFFNGITIMKRYGVLF